MCFIKSDNKILKFWDNFSFSSSCDIYIAKNLLGFIPAEPSFHFLE